MHDSSLPCVWLLVCLIFIGTEKVDTLKSSVLGTSDLQVWVIIVPVGLALILLVGVLLLCCFLKKRRKNQKEKKVEVYQGLQEMEMRNAEHIYNEHIDPSDAYSTIDD